MYHIGIDPGIKGALAIIEYENVEIYDMPLLPNNEVDVDGLKELLQFDRQVFCILEKAQPMPNQSAQSGFNYGVGYGTIKAALRFYSIPFQEVHPAKWKREFSLIKKSKEESATKCLELFPQLKKELFYTERGRLLDGRAEALLLCEYGRRIK